MVSLPVKTVVMEMADNTPSRDGPERDPDTGRFVEEHSEQEYLSALRRLGGDGSTTEVARLVGSEYDAAYKKLRQLEQNGQITSRKVASARLWEIQDDG
jgi:hypothetical protein